MIKSNHFTRLNQNMISIVSEAAEHSKGLTTGSLFAELFSRKNFCSMYISTDIDPKKVALDFLETIPEERVGSISSEAEALLYETSRRARDRYQNEQSFFLNALTCGGPGTTAIRNVLSKYFDINNLVNDLQEMVPAAPINTWESNKETILDAFGINLSQQALDGEIEEALNRDQEIQRTIQILIRKTKSNPILVGKPGTGKTAIVEGLAHILNKGEGIPVRLARTKIYQLNVAALLAAGGQPGALEKILDQVIQAAKIEDVVLFIDEVHVIMDSNARMANALKPAMARGDIRLIGATTEDEFKAAFDKDEAVQRRFQPVRIKEQDKTSVYRIIQQKASAMEKFHNVIVPNIALLTAIQLSDKFIPDRQQPDKAIDLIEEASARLRMALEAKPDEMVKLLDKLGELNIEKEMLEVKFGDHLSDKDKAKIQKINTKAQVLELELTEMTALYDVQKRVIDELVITKEQLIEANEEHSNAMHSGDFSKAQEIKYNEIPVLEKKVQTLEEEMLSMNTDGSLIRNVVQDDMIAKVIETWTGIPVSAQDQDSLAKYKDMDKILKSEVHGQDRAIDAISIAIKRSKAGLNEANKPLGSFLCLGPTGVGKTYLAQKLSEFLFDTDKVLQRYDMSEYMEPHSVSKLFGSPPGYVGYAECGQLTEAVRRNPYSILLFDEIEKAHPRVFDTLLQVLDAGRMTDGQGRTVNFKNTVIIMTSNTGAHLIQQGIEQGYGMETIEAALEEELKNHFKPEFLNRFDAKITFNSLQVEDIVRIVGSELQKFSEKLHQENDIELHWNPKVPAGIAIVAYDPLNGARPIKRFINDKIVSQLTEMILNQEIRKDSVVYLDIFGEEFVLNVVTDQEMKEIKSSLDQETIDVAVIDEKQIKKAKKKAKEKQKEIKDFNRVPASEIVDADVELSFPKTETGDGN